MIAREIAVYADAQGLRIESPYRNGGAEAFHTAWLWVKETAPDALRAFLEEAFRRYWGMDLDPTKDADVVALVEKPGLDAGRFRDWAASNGPTALEAVASALSDAGVDQGPAYLVDSEVFYGRQHLPMIRWILAGRRGERPI
jgi:2-hydroxychromene-2-carboxylate isomerase